MKRKVSEHIVKAREGVSHEIYKMHLHEVMVIECETTDELWTSVMRVPGGWIYRSYHKGDKIFFSTFVPHNREFTRGEFV